MTVRSLMAALALALPSTLLAQDARWVTQVTDLYPSPSPDGSRVVFQTTRTGRTALAIADTAGAIIGVFPGAGARITPSWSPDGRRIVFAEVVDRQLDLFVMNADGSGVQRLTTHPGADMHPRWSADGSRIFFNSDRSRTEAAPAGTVQDIFSMSAQGADVRQHTDCRATCTYPAPSPDGRMIAYRKVVPRPGFNWDLTPNTGDSDIMVASVDGSGERSIAPNAAFDGWPAWSPDGRWIAFASNRAGPALVGQIHLVRPDGTGLRQVTSGPWSHAQPNFTADSRKVLVYRLQEGADFQFGFITAITLGSRLDG